MKRMLKKLRTKGSFSKNKLYPVLSTLWFLSTLKLIPIKGGEKKYPKVIQLPITYFCNARCVMCDVWNMDYSGELTAKELKAVLTDPVFKKVEGVGINGGEPSLIKNLDEYAEVIINQLPNLRSLNIISHGFHTSRLLALLKSIYFLCNKKGISFHVSVSLDGYGEIHDKVRGIPKVFKKTFETIKEIKANRSLYCDSFDVGCTVISQNVNYLEQLNAFAKKIEIQIKFRMGIENKRIESEKLFPSFSGFNGKGLFSSKTFFYSQYKNSKTISDKFKYFSIFNSINNGRSKRLMGCNWKNQGITLDSRGNIYYCAVESECIGNLKNTPGEKIFFDEAHLKYRESIVQNKCDSCVHDYYGNPEIKNFLIFVFQVLHERFWAKIYAFKLRFMI